MAESFRYRNGPGALAHLLWVNENPNPATICPCCRPMIGSVWTPGTEPPLPVHPNCYCLYVPTEKPVTSPPDPHTFTPDAWAAWIRYTAYLLRTEREIVPWLEPFIEEAEEYNRNREEESMPPDHTTPVIEVPDQSAGLVQATRSVAVVVRNGVVRLAPIDRSVDRRSYLCDFIHAGPVKQADQQPAPWVIRAEALAAGAPLFGARPVYLDHPRLFGFGWHQQPRVADMVGITSQPTWDPASDAITGKLTLYDRQEGSPGHFVGVLLDQIMEDQAKGLAVPPLGLSAVFYHESTEDEETGIRYTNVIHHVESVDVVYDPGAAGYIREALSAVQATYWPVTQEIKTMTEETPTYEVATPDPDPAPEALAAPAPEDAFAGALNTISAQLAALQTRQDELAATLAGQAEATAITGMEPPAGSVYGMLSSLDKVETALEAMLAGVRPPDGIRPLTGLRELYTLLSGDFEMTGVFQTDRVYLANVTTSTMAGLVANALNKRVVNEFQTYPKWWAPAVTEMDFPSLQDPRFITLGGVGELPTVAEGAQYSEMTWDDQTETATFAKKGGYLGLTIEAIDKDDVSKLRAAPRALAQAAWMTLGKSIAAVFTSNSAYGAQMSDGNYLFDNSNHSNQGSTAFSHTSYVATKLLMRKFTELNSGERLGVLVAPKFLWVPVDLEASAVEELAAGEGLIGSADYHVNDEAASDSMSARIRRARERVITVPFWTDTNDWVLQADPSLYPGLGLAYRYGRTPEIYSVASPTAGLMFTNDTMPIKVRFFYAIQPTDWRAWYKHIVS